MTRIDRPADGAHTSTRVADDGTKWMDTIADLDDEGTDALLRGEASSPGLTPLAHVVRRLRESVATETLPPMSAQLRAQIDAPLVVALHARRLAGRTLVRAALAAAAAVVALVGAGATQNRLPGGLQDVVSSAAEIVGLDVPRSVERHADDDHDPVEVEGEVDSTDAPGHDGEPGYEGTTPGGATPADPGTPGDHEPAVPATPPEGHGQSDPPGPPATLPDNNASPTGQENSGRGADTSRAGKG